MKENMTGNYKKALEILENRNSKIAINYKLKNRDFANKELEEISEVLITFVIPALQQAVDKAEKYDNKETPVTIIDRGIKHSGWILWWCPKCGRNLGSGQKKLFNYCPDCGNKLKRPERPESGYVRHNTSTTIDTIFEEKSPFEKRLQELIEISNNARGIIMFNKAWGNNYEAYYIYDFHFVQPNTVIIGAGTHTTDVLKEEYENNGLDWKIGTRSY